MSISIHQLTSDQIDVFEELLSVFGEAFNDKDTYNNHRPSNHYLKKLLNRDTFVALAAKCNGKVIGGLAAYELTKFEQERSEIYIYDLAVLAEYRRQGVATQLIQALQTIGAERGAYVIFVQADTAVEDEPAIALYSKLGIREDVLHFDIAINNK